MYVINIYLYTKPIYIYVCVYANEYISYICNWYCNITDNALLYMILMSYYILLYAN